MNMFQMKEQDKTSAGVIARLQSDGHKDDQRTWGKEWMGMVRISTKNRKYNKIPTSSQRAQE